MPQQVGNFSEDSQTNVTPSLQPQPSTSVESLPDDALAAAGLKKVTAFVRVDPKGQAERAKKIREKRALGGVAQLNVLAPVSCHQTIKSVAKAFQSSGDVQPVLEQLLTSELRAKNPDALVVVTTSARQKVLENLERRLSRLTGFRKFIARLLGML